MDIFKERENQVVSKLLFIQGGQPIYQYKQVLKLLKEMIQELEGYDKKPHLLDYRITNKLRYLYSSMNSLHPLKLKRLRFKSSETPCPTFCKCLHFH